MVFLICVYDFKYWYVFFDWVFFIIIYIYIFKIVISCLFYFFEFFDKLFFLSIICFVEYIYMYVFFLDLDNVFILSINSRSFNGIILKVLI